MKTFIGVLTLISIPSSVTAQVLVPTAPIVTRSTYSARDSHTRDNPASSASNSPAGDAADLQSSEQTSSSQKDFTGEKKSNHGRLEQEPPVPRVRYMFLP